MMHLHDYDPNPETFEPEEKLPARTRRFVLLAMLALCAFVWWLMLS